MDEPVIVCESQRNHMWEVAKNDHPEWIENGYLIIPEHAFKYSLDGVNSVWAKGIFFPIYTDLIKSSNELEVLVEKIHRSQDDLYNDGDLLERINCVDFYELQDLSIEKLNKNEWNVDSELVECYSELNIEEMPPIIVHKYSDDSYSIVDGIHRLNVCYKKGLKNIKAYVGLRK